MSEAVIQAKIRAFDEFTNTFRKYEQELRKVEKTQKDTAQSTKLVNRATGEFLGTLGNIGAILAFQQGLQNVMQVGREFELTIKQAQAVTGDFSNTLRDLSMTSQGGKLDVFTPTQLAQAYRELGQAGASTNEIMAATPEIMEFGVASLLNTEQATYGVLAAAKSFNVALTDVGQITDAYTEAMNRGALAGQDFQWIMSSAGAVAKMAGQDFQEILSVGSVMRDAGVQAQDAGTSIKSALLALINPTKEARETMKDLGINVYDASGKMKQWSDIVAEFERALAPYNEQSRQLVLTTVLGSDGIRAMATSLNKGSGYLKEFTEGLKNADGATNKMAEAMANTFDGALRRTNANLERTKILLFEEFSGASIGVLNAINSLLTGFNSLDEGTRRLILSLVGGVGLAAAVLMTVSALKQLAAAMKLVQVASGPWGWVALAIGVAGAAALNYAGSIEEAKKKQQELNRETEEFARIAKEGIGKDQVDSSRQRIQAIDEEIAKLKERKAELNTSVDKVIAQYSNDTINLGAHSASVQKLREEIAKLDAEIARKTENQKILNQEIEKATVLDTQATQSMANKAVQAKLEAQEINSLAKRYIELAGKKNLNAKESQDLSTALATLAAKYPFLISETDQHGKATKLNTQALNEQAETTKLLAQAQYTEAMNSILQQKTKTQVFIEQSIKRIEMLELERKALAQVSVEQQQMYDAFGMKKPAVAPGELGINKATKQNQDDLTEAKKKLEEYQRANSTMGSILETARNMKISGGATGDQIWKPPGKDKDKDKNKALEAAKKYVDAMTASLYPYRAATEAAAGALSVFGANEEYLNQVMQSGNATVFQAIELNRVREAQGKQLQAQQKALREEMSAQEKELSKLKAQEKTAHDSEAIKQYRDAIGNLTQSITQNRQALWQSESQELAILTELKQERQKVYDDAFQKAMDLMRHQVNMSRMSTEQQIEYLQKLKNAHAWSQQQMRTIEEDLYRLRKQQLSEFLDSMEEQYKSKLDAIDANTKQKVKDLQDQIDALNKEGKTADRAEALKKHNDKIKELQDKKKYHELRTGQEHKKAIAEIEKEIAEENRQWELQKAEQTREDKKESLQQQIQDAQEAGEKERKQLEEHYRKVMNLAEKGALDTLAALAATNPQWLETGKAWIKSLMDGISLAAPEFEALVKEKTDAMAGFKGQLPTTTTTPEMPWQVTYNKNKDIWDRDSKLPGVKAGDKNTWTQAMLDAFRQNEEFRKKYGITDTGKIPGYDKGGPIWETSLALVHKDEYMIPANLVDAIRRGAPAPASPGWVSGGGNFAQAIEAASDRIVAAINAKMGVNIQNLLNIEHNDMGAEVDVDVLAGGLRRAIVNLAGAK